jgi:hypothetical protein
MIGGEMKIRTVISMVAAAVVLASGLALPAAASNASTSAKEASPPATGQGIFVLGSPSTSTPEGAEFYAIPEEYRDALVIAPDVAADLQLPPGPVADSDVTEVAAKVAAVEEVSRKGGSQSPDSGFTTTDVNGTSFTYGQEPPGLAPTSETLRFQAAATTTTHGTSTVRILMRACRAKVGTQATTGVASACGRPGIPWDAVKAVAPKFPGTTSRAIQK